MLKIINAELHRLGQHFLDEVWGDENDPRKRDTPYVSKEDASPTPHGEQGVIDETNFEDYEPSEAESETGGFLDEIPDREDMFEIEDHEPTDPTKGTNEIIYTGQPPYTMQKLVYDGIDNAEVITFEYINRFNEYAGTRKVEPHYTFVAATTKNEVLVTWDLDKQGIRAFIVGNIHPYGVRYEGAQFQQDDPEKLGLPREEIMTGVY